MKLPISARTLVAALIAAFLLAATGHLLLWPTSSTLAQKKKQKLCGGRPCPPSPSPSPTKKSSTSSSSGGPVEPPCNAFPAREILFNEVKDDSIANNTSSCRREGGRKIFYHEYKLRATRNDQFVIQLVPYIEQKLSSVTNVPSGSPNNRQRLEVIKPNLDDPLFNARLLTASDAVVDLQPRTKEGMYYLAKGHVAADGEYKLRVEYIGAQNNVRYALRVRKSQLSFDQTVTSRWHVALAHQQPTDAPGVLNLWDTYDLELTQEDWFSIDLKTNTRSYNPRPFLVRAGAEPSALELTPDPALPSRWYLKTRLPSDGRLLLRVQVPNVNTVLDQWVDYTLSVNRREWSQSEFDKRVEEIFTTHIERPATAKNPDEAIRRLERMKSVANGKLGPKAAEYLGFIYLYEKGDRIKALDAMRQAINQNGSALFRVKMTNGSQVRWLKIDLKYLSFAVNSGVCEFCGPFVLPALTYDPRRADRNRVILIVDKKAHDFMIEPLNKTAEKLLIDTVLQKSLPSQ